MLHGPQLRRRVQCTATWHSGTDTKLSARGVTRSPQSRVQTTRRQCAPHTCRARPPQTSHHRSSLLLVTQQATCPSFFYPASAEEKSMRALAGATPRTAQPPPTRPRHKPPPPSPPIRSPRCVMQCQATRPGTQASARCDATSGSCYKHSKTAGQARATNRGPVCTGPTSTGKHTRSEGDTQAQMVG